MIVWYRTFEFKSIVRIHLWYNHKFEPKIRVN